MFCARPSPINLPRFSALYSATGSSVRAVHSAFAFTSLLRHAANFCAPRAVRVVPGLLGRKAWLVMPRSGHDRPSDARHFVGQGDRHKLEGFFRQQSSCPVGQWRLGLAVFDAVECGMSSECWFHAELSRLGATPPTAQFCLETYRINDARCTTFPSCRLLLDNGLEQATRSFHNRTSGIEYECASVTCL